jgi:hypothetical protein
LLARPAWASLPLPAEREIRFQLVRLGSAIGTHSLAFAAADGRLTVRVVVEARVTLLSIPIVRYAHRVTERWEGDRLVGLSSETDRNGRREWMAAQRSEAGLVVSGSRTETYVAPEGAIGTSYWNKRMLDGPMISLEDGVLLRPWVTQGAREAIPLAAGGTVTARRYSLTGPFAVDVWYDGADGWAGLAFDGPDGLRVHYERL